jgi:hypothetical protein
MRWKGQRKIEGNRTKEEEKRRIKKRMEGRRRKERIIREVRETKISSGSNGQNILESVGSQAVPPCPDNGRLERG